MKKEIKELYSSSYQTINGNYGFVDLKDNGSLKVRISRPLEDGSYERDGFTVSCDNLKEICKILKKLDMI